MTKAAEPPADRAREESWSYERFCEALLSTEVPRASRTAARAGSSQRASRPERRSRNSTRPRCSTTCFRTEAKPAGGLEAELRRLSFVPLIVVDEVGYIPFDPRRRS
jgi:hypothetical protein